MFFLELLRVLSGNHPYIGTGIIKFDLLIYHKKFKRNEYSGHPIVVLIIGDNEHRHRVGDCHSIEGCAGDRIWLEPQGNVAWT